ncbi:unnamed protein product [Phaedon cochleariae]|uniref:DUF7869 domain-containing protein n=1 Tax=Phaedon cochleariae TaxID=80249 RepID=A0A9P0DPT4_PHACE|nr:unnamed protein product [Phaedon cochleariae]
MGSRIEKIFAALKKPNGILDGNSLVKSSIANVSDDLIANSDGLLPHNTPDISRSESSPVEETVPNVSGLDMDYNNLQQHDTPNYSRLEATLVETTVVNIIRDPVMNLDNFLLHETPNIMELGLTEVMDVAKVSDSVIDSNGLLLHITPNSLDGATSTDADVLLLHCSPNSSRLNIIDNSMPVRAADETDDYILHELQTYKPTLDRNSPLDLEASTFATPQEYSEITIFPRTQVVEDNTNTEEELPFIEDQETFENAGETDISENNFNGEENCDGVDNDYVPSDESDIDSSSSEIEDPDDLNDIKSSRKRKMKTTAHNRKQVEVIDESNRTKEHEIQPGTSFQVTPTPSMQNGDETVGEEGVRREKRKNNRKEMKKRRNAGEEYSTVKGKKKESRKVRENSCKTSKRCFNECKHFTEDERLGIFKTYWNLDHQRKRDWLLKSMVRVPVKRNKNLSQRNCTYNYFISKGGENKRVCKNFLLNTLDITVKLFQYTRDNSLKENLELSKTDNRGKHTPPNKTPPDITENCRAFIKNLPAIPSHYCRKDNDRKYLPVEFQNVSNLFRIYRHHFNSLNEPHVNEKLFKKIFKDDFNIGFHQPKKDKCNTCEQYKNIPDEDKSETLQENYASHQQEARASKNIFIEKQKRIENNPRSLCVSFDLQKVLNTPHGNSMLLFYSRKYAYYNFSVYESGRRNGYCYLWGESDGNRGSNDICTALNMYIKKIDDENSTEELFLFCDSCSGQNKNSLILSMIKYTLDKCKHLNSIEVNYLIPGHTYMPVDSVHATIERSLKGRIIYAPSEWPTVIKFSRKDEKLKPFEAIALQHSDFMDWKPVQKKYFLIIRAKENM